MKFHTIFINKRNFTPSPHHLIGGCQDRFDDFLMVSDAVRLVVLVNRDPDEQELLVTECRPKSCRKLGRTGMELMYDIRWVVSLSQRSGDMPEQVRSCVV